MFDRDIFAIGMALSQEQINKVNFPSKGVRSVADYFLKTIEEAKAREEAARNAEQAKIKAEMEAKAKAIADSAAKEAAEAATKAAAIVLTEDSAAREKVVLDEQKNEIQELKNTIKKQQNALNAQQNALDMQKLATNYIELAKQNQYLLEVIKTLSNPMDSLLLGAAESNDIEKVEAAIKLGANINAQDQGLETALHKASRQNNFKIVKYLLEQGANPNLKNAQQKTAFELTTAADIMKLFPNDQVTSNFRPSSPSFFANASFSTNDKVLEIEKEEKLSGIELN